MTTYTRFLVRLFWIGGKKKRYIVAHCHKVYNLMKVKRWSWLWWWVNIYYFGDNQSFDLKWFQFSDQRDETLLVIIRQRYYIYSSRMNIQHRLVSPFRLFQKLKCIPWSTSKSSVITALEISIYCSFCFAAFLLASICGIRFWLGKFDFGLVCCCQDNWLIEYYCNLFYLVTYLYINYICHFRVIVSSRVTRQLSFFTYSGSDPYSAKQVCPIWFGHFVYMK